MGSEPKIVSETHGSVSLIRLNNPRQKNALNYEVLEALAQTFDAHVSRSETGVVIFTGAADVFASGADINELRRMTAAGGREFAGRGQRIFQSIANARQLTIAAINGHCIGGALDLALACDFRFASRTATFRHPGARLGIITGWGGTRRLPRLIGTAAALELFTTARTINSQEAFERGLVTRIADPVVEGACEFAQDWLTRRESGVENM